jgi:hypothetical protein
VSNDGLEGVGMWKGGADNVVGRERGSSISSRRISDGKG